MNDITIIRRFTPPPYPDEREGFERQAAAWLRGQGLVVSVDEPSKVEYGDGSITLVASVTARAA